MHIKSPLISKNNYYDGKCKQLIVSNIMSVTTVCWKLIRFTQDLFPFFNIMDHSDPAPPPCIRSGH